MNGEAYEHEMMYERLFVVCSSAAYQEHAVIASTRTAEDAVAIKNQRKFGSAWKVEMLTKWSTPIVEKLA